MDIEVSSVTQFGILTFWNRQLGGIYVVFRSNRLIGRFPSGVGRGWSSRGFDGPKRQGGNSGDQLAGINREIRNEGR
jgi:hypothetical protein